MPLRLDIKRKMTMRSDRVKSLDFHPSEPWLMISLYNGDVDIWDYKTDIKIKTLEVCEVPVRAAKFIMRKRWVVAGCDDMFIRVFNYNTLEKVHCFEAHTDYIRCIIVHPSQPYVLSSSDDLTIKMWDWEENWECLQVYEGHAHYVMQIGFNPKNNNSFVSASLDTTLKVWGLGAGKPNYTLHGHEKGVNCVEYHPSPDKPYIISGGDDRCIKIWDYQTQTCIHTLEGHTSNVTTVSFHPELPIIMSGSEDGSIKLWHNSTYVLEGSYNYGYERVWTMAVHRGTAEVAVGYDLGSILVKIGRDQPPISMDVNGEKIIYAKNNEIQQVNLKALAEGTEIKDGDRLELPIKDLGTCEILPQTLSYNFNGRFVVVCGNGEYIIYTSMALRNKGFGNGLEFVWSSNSSEYAIMESSESVKVYQNFQEKETFEPDLGADGIFGGFMLGVKSLGGKAVSFYDWDRIELIRRIELKVVHVFWSDNGGHVCLAADEEYFVLKYKPAVVTLARATNADISKDGIKEAFEIVGGVRESVKTGIWIGDCFVYMNEYNALSYFVGGETVNVANLEGPMHILGYVAKDNRLYLSDKDMNIVSYCLLLSVMEYQTAVMRNDFDAADKVLPLIPTEHRMRVAYFLEKQGFKKQALAVSTDLGHKFELALATKSLQLARKLADDADTAGVASSSSRWMRLSAAAANAGNLAMSVECCRKSGDFGNLLIYATTVGDKVLMNEIAEICRQKGQYNIAFLCYFTLGELGLCIKLLTDAQRYPEAAIFARSYMPSKVPQMVVLWKRHLANKSVKTAEAIANPDKYENLFPNFLTSVDLETFQKDCGYPQSVQMENVPRNYALNNADRNLAKEKDEAVKKGLWVARPSTREREEVLARAEAERRSRIDYPERLLCSPRDVMEATKNTPPRMDFDMAELDRELKAMEDELGEAFYNDVDDVEDADVEEFLDDGQSAMGLF